MQNINFTLLIFPFCFIFGQLNEESCTISASNHLDEFNIKGKVHFIIETVSNEKKFNIEKNNFEFPSQEDTIFYINKIEFNSVGNIESIKKYKKISDEPYSEELCFYNKNGSLEEVIIKTHGRLQRKSEIIYDEQNISRKYFSYFTPDSPPQLYLTDIYNKAGQIEKKISHLHPQSTDEYTYSNNLLNGYSTKKESGNGQIVSYKYEKNNPIEIKYKGYNGNETLYKYIFDQNNNIISKSTISNGYKQSESIINYKYDENQNWKSKNIIRNTFQLSKIKNSFSKVSTRNYEFYK